MADSTMEVLQRNFGPARSGENTVFGARRPGYSLANPSEDVPGWIAFMRSNKIARVCCLLDDRQLGLYADGLLDSYVREFGKQSVCAAPIPDFRVCPTSLFKGKVLPFFREADEDGSRVVVHCSYGSGRTGHILAAWLVAGRGLAPEAAAVSVEEAGPERFPFEAGHKEVFAFLSSL